jgi:tetratricopeptide (TPR) repeat protein
MASASWSMCAAMLCALLLTAAGVEAQAKPGTKPPATVDDQEARDLFRLGKQAFDEGRYERALKYFKDAYDLSGRAQLQFNIGTVLDRLRRDREAVTAYKSYLSQTPDATNRAVVEERIRLIEDAMSKSETPAAPALVPTGPQPTASTPAPAAGTLQPSAARPATVPTPAETARAASPSEPAGEHASASATASAESSGSVASRWWFWTGIGAVVAGAVVVGVVVGSRSGTSGTESPAVLGASTRVRSL